MNDLILTQIHEIKNQKVCEAIVSELFASVFSMEVRDKQRCVHLFLLLLHLLAQEVEEEEEEDEDGSGMIILAPFSQIPYFKKSGYGPTNGQTDQRTGQRTDRWTDKASYRDAWMHLKISMSKGRRN